MYEKQLKEIRCILEAQGWSEEDIKEKMDLLRDILTEDKE